MPVSQTQGWLPLCQASSLPLSHVSQSCKEMNPVKVLYLAKYPGRRVGLGAQSGGLFCLQLPEGLQWPGNRQSSLSTNDLVPFISPCM